ncbi:MAG: class I SAM-dependent methyltransferase, partial [Lachnospiraceae bacterium]|nr:class I SAM-dependent methyltransferase [Lachnospiraceae bacterium]
SFGLRNCADPQQVLEEIYRVLRPGGEILCLESFVPDSAVVKPFYRLYFGRIMPLLGGGRSNRKEYEWLQESTESFLRSKELSHLMRRCGFVDVRVRRRMMGACAMHVAVKPGCRKQ